MIKKTSSLLVSIFLFVTSCSSLTQIEVQDKRHALDAMAEKAIAGLLEQEPNLQEKLDMSLVHGVVNMKVTKVPIVGAGGGEGVLLIKNSRQRIYFKVSRFDIGGGWGVRSYKTLLLINKQDLVDKWKEGKWVFQAGAEASAGTATAEGASGGDNDGFSLHILADGGASATATARVIRIKVNNELTENL